MLEELDSKLWDFKQGKKRGLSKGLGIDLKQLSAKQLTRDQMLQLECLKIQ
jgi:hypothetical protein